MDTPATFQDVFEPIYQEALALLIERQRKYGSENIRQQGIYGVFTRLRDDKLSRLANAMNGRVVNGRVELDPMPIPVGTADDSFEDALLDVANYALIMLALKRGLWGKPLREETAADAKWIGEFIRANSPGLRIPGVHASECTSKHCPGCYV